jgi:hypothetical protein
LISHIISFTGLKLVFYLKNQVNVFLDQSHHFIISFTGLKLVFYLKNQVNVFLISHIISLIFFLNF